MLQKFVKMERIFQFLARLNVEFDQVRMQVLGKQEMSSLSEVFSLIQAKESQRVIMLHTQITEGFVMVSLK